MLITRETDYAIRTIRALSDHRLLTVKQICEQEAIPTQFAYKILKKLARAGVVEIMRGACGGYRLVSDLKELTLFDVMQATGENVNINECLQIGYHCVNNCEGKECCIHREIGRIQDLLHNELRRYSFDEIMSHRDSEKAN